MTYSPETNNSALIGELIKGKVRINGKAQRNSLSSTDIHTLVPISITHGVWIFFMRQMQGGGGGRGAMSLAKVKLKCKLRIKSKLHLKTLLELKRLKRK